MNRLNFTKAYDYDMDKILKDARLAYHSHRVFELMDIAINSISDNNSFVTSIERVGSTLRDCDISTQNIQVLNTSYYVLSQCFLSNNR